MSSIPGRALPWLQRSLNALNGTRTVPVLSFLPYIRYGSFFQKLPPLVCSLSVSTRRLSCPKGQRAASPLEIPLRIKGASPLTKQIKFIASALNFFAFIPIHPTDRSSGWKGTAVPSEQSSYPACGREVLSVGDHIQQFYFINHFSGLIEIRLCNQTQKLCQCCSEKA